MDGITNGNTDKKTMYSGMFTDASYEVIIINDHFQFSPADVRSVDVKISGEDATIMLVTTHEKLMIIESDIASIDFLVRRGEIDFEEIFDKMKSGFVEIILDEMTMKNSIVLNVDEIISYGVYGTARQMMMVETENEIFHFFVDRVARICIFKKKKEMKKRKWWKKNGIE